MDRDVWHDKYKERLSEIVRSHRSAPQEAVIAKLNPIIRGWCNYYRTVVSKEIFTDMDEYLWKILWHRATRRHPNKTGKWIARKYWAMTGERRWRFSSKSKEGNEIELNRHCETKIIRHVKVKGTASPFNREIVYWSQRLGKSPDVSRRISKLIKKQKGKCLHCGLKFKHGDRWEVDHIKPVSKGGKDWYENLQLLHDYCHDYKSARDGSKSRIHDKDGETEEPDEVKVSRPVLKTSRRGDPMA